MKTVLISGANGQLMIDIIKELKKFPEDFDVKTRNRTELNVTDRFALEKAFEVYEPDVYIHGASVHSLPHIDDNPENASNVNIASLHRAAKLCNFHECLLVNFSTNYVFGFENVMPQFDVRINDDGISEGAQPNPANIYGILKAAGERVVATRAERYYNFRVAGLFGLTGSRAKNNNNFIYAMLKEYTNGGKVDVVDDQVMNVGYTVDIAEVVADILKRGNSDYVCRGTYHITNKGALSWYDLAKFIAECIGYDTEKVIPVTSNDFYDGIQRPKYTALSMQCLNNYGITMPTWQSGVVRFLNEIDAKWKTI